MKKTNVEFIADLMEYGDPMKQLIIMHAVQEYADLVAGAESLEWGEDSFINPDAWKRACEEISAAFEARHA